MDEIVLHNGPSRGARWVHKKSAVGRNGNRSWLVDTERSSADSMARKYCDPHGEPERTQHSGRDVLTLDVVVALG